MVCRQLAPPRKSSAPYIGQNGEYWVLHCKNHFSLSICMQINHYLVERQCICMLICVRLNSCELITNDLIQLLMLNLVNLPHVPLQPLSPAR